MSEENTDRELTRLRAFFREVAELTEDHDVLDDHAVVYPSKLGKALERVDLNWHRWYGDEAQPPQALATKETP